MPKSRSIDSFANARLAAIVESSDDAIISKDLNGIITSWNRAAERLYGYSAEEAIGKPVAITAPPGREGEMLEIVARIRRGEKVEHYETERRHRDGTLIPISLTVSPIYDEQGRVVGASKIARDISERRRADQQLRLLMGEIDHRAKNVLAVAQAILRLTRADNLDDFVAAVEGRLGALALVHTQVAENRWSGATLRKLVASALATFGDDHGRATIEGPHVWVSPAAAQVVGVVLHELATNAAKHGALSVSRGTLTVGWSLGRDGGLCLRWEERGGPPVTEPTRRSFGTQVIERNVPDQLGGTAEIRWLPAGLRCLFTIPPASVVQGRMPSDAAVALG